MEVGLCGIGIAGRRQEILLFRYWYTQEHPQVDQVCSRTIFWMSTLQGGKIGSGLLNTRRFMAWGRNRAYWPCLHLWTI